MANHRAGAAVCESAAIWWHQRGDAPPPTRADALAILEVICRPWEGGDLEFDDVDDEGNQVVGTHPTAPLGRLVAIAFDATPEQAACVEDEDGSGMEPWTSGPRSAFKRAFGLW